jgi:atypical dual specificity phosphatase
MLSMSRWFLLYGFADVGDELLIGAFPLDRDDVQTLARLQVDRIVNLVEDSEYEPGARSAVEAALAGVDIEEVRIPLIDHGGLPSIEIEAAVQQTIAWLDEGHRVYLHCRAGRQRSAAVAAGVVAIRDGLEIDDALGLVQARKPSAEPLPHQLQDLLWWWRERAPAR